MTARSLSRARLIIEELRKVDAEMPATYATALLLIAIEEGISQSELMKRVGTNKSTIQRIVNRFSAKGGEQAPGYDIAETRVAPHDARVRQIFLTPKGRRVIASLVH